MSGNPRENTRDRGFWDGGSRGHGKDTETAGRPTGYPGGRKRGKLGVMIDIDAAEEKGRGIDRTPK